MAVVLDITELRADDDAVIPWLDNGFASTTSFNSSMQAKRSGRTRMFPSKLQTTISGKNGAGLRSKTDGPSMVGTDSLGSTGSQRSNRIRSAGPAGTSAGPASMTSARSDGSARRDKDIHRSLSAASANSANSFGMRRKNSGNRQRRRQLQKSREPSQDSMDSAIQSLDPLSGPPPCHSIETHKKGLCEVHRFNMYEAPRNHKCNECGRHFHTGSEFYGCENCPFDICKACRMSAPCEMVETPPPSSRPAELKTIYSSISLRDVSLPMSLPMASRDPDKCPVSSSREDIVGHEDSKDSMVSIVSMPSSVRPKACRRCHSTFVGFGIECPPCRSAGPQGAIRQCVGCGQFFKGFGNMCEECRP